MTTHLSLPYPTRPLQDDADTEQELLNLLEARRIAADQLAFLDMLIAARRIPLPGLVAAEQGVLPW